MGRIKLEEVDLGLGTQADHDPLYDTRTLLKQSIGTETGDYREIPLSEISVNPNNDYAAEDSEEEILSLAQDIEQNGLLHNIVVSEKKGPEGTRYLILSGERRFRAYRWLFENRRDNRYAVILCKVLSGLDELDEMLVLDAANLQSRGGIGNEKKYRKATLRFIGNLKKKGGASEEEARELAIRFTGISEALLDKNVLVENELNPKILSLLDRDLIPKNQAVAYARLPDEIQEIVADHLVRAYEQGTSELKDVNERLSVAVRTVAELRGRLQQQEKGAGDVDQEIETARQSLNALQKLSDAGERSPELAMQMDQVRRSILELEAQKRMYASTISSARQALRRSEEKLSQIQPNAPSGTKTADLAILLNKSMKKA
ncbi:MAG: ParB N-terminal domain-containing protein, partial [Candidatus Methanomethylophilaceae archaeon]|nr:ParB N-terminal domain-containing protein [Candidatus Methanomethylophilaceae archaeon]